MNLWLTLILLCTLIAGLQGFLLSTRQHIHLRMEQDLFIGDRAEAISLRERQVQASNLELRSLQASCLAMLALPPAASQSALRAARALANVIAKGQDAWRLAIQAELFSSRTRGYKINGELGSARESNACAITGPLVKPLAQEIVMSGESAGVIIDLNSEITWRFSHAQSGDEWF